MATQFKMLPDWQKKLLLSKQANAGVNARADALGDAIRSLGEVDHDGNPISVRVVHGGRERKRSYAFVGLTNAFARQLEAKRGILNRVL